MGAVAVPTSTVASQPALQCVRTLTAAPGGLRAAAVNVLTHCNAGVDGRTRRLARGGRPDERQARVADPAVYGDILVADLRRPQERRGGALLGPQRLEPGRHPLDRPAEVDGRGPGREKRGPGRPQGGVGGIGPQREAEAVGGCGPDERRAPDPHRPDGVRHLVKGSQPRDGKLVGQPRLVDDLERGAVGARPEGPVVPAVDLQITLSFPPSTGIWAPVVLAKSGPQSSAASSATSRLAISTRSTLFVL